GESLGIVGESGAGKSSLALALVQLIKSKGQIVFLGQDLNQLQPKVLRLIRSDFQLVFQDPFGSLNPRMTVGQIIAEGLKLKAANDKEIKQQV
ncbi:ATP-binding cassette domain-containing protein, partial [Acinetobacter pittii]